MILTEFRGFSKIKEKFTNKHTFLFFCLSLSFLFLVESVMGYYYPIILEEAFGSNFSAGLVIGLCNIAALTCDFVFPEIFKKKTWKFLYLAAVIIQIGFPAFTNLAVIFGGVGLLVVAGLFWNIYYEFMAFARQNFIVTNEKKEDYSRAWGIISVLGSLTSIIGPIIGSLLLRETMGNRVGFFAVVQMISLVIALFLVLLSPGKAQEHKLEVHVHKKLNIFKDLKFWEILGARVFPIILVGIIISLISGAVMTFGGLMGKELFSGGDLDWLLVIVFAVPSIIASLFLVRFPVKKFKKLLSQILIIAGGFCLCLLPFIGHQPFLILTAFFLCSLFLSIAWIFNEAVYSDLSERAGNEKLYLNGMERINDSIGYMIGPIAIGLLADKTDYYVAFSFLGFFCMIVGIILMMVTPRKIFIPHKELNELEDL